MSRIGIFGGTFNPPHIGHIEAARACVNALSLDKLYLVPANVPPHKIMPENSASSARRLDMCRLAAVEVPNCTVLDIELLRQGKSYSVDTVREIRAMHEGDSLWLIIGTDMLLSFEKWYMPQEIAGMCRLAVCARTEDRQALLNAAERLGRSIGARVDIIHNRVVQMSSTDFRGGLCEQLLPKSVLEYIKNNNLYGFSDSLCRLRELAKERLSQERFTHTIGCEKMAEELALRWNVDTFEAKTAAIVHDLTKNEPFDGQLLLLKKYGIIPQYDIKKYKMLLHSDTSAAYAKYELGLSENVSRAIERHTTGDADMSALDKIIYIADKLEQNRDFAGVEHLRALAFEDLDKCLIEVIENNLEYMKSKGQQPFERTQNALDYLKNITV